MPWQNALCDVKWVGLGRVGGVGWECFLFFFCGHQLEDICV